MSGYFSAVVGPAGVPKACDRKDIGCQTCVSATIDSQRFFDRVANPANAKRAADFDAARRRVLNALRRLSSQHLAVIAVSTGDDLALELFCGATRLQRLRERGHR